MIGTYGHMSEVFMLGFQSQRFQGYGRELVPGGWDKINLQVEYKNYYYNLFIVIMIISTVILCV